MTNDDPNIEGETTVEMGGNFVPSELALGHEGRTFIKSYERHSRSHDKTIAAMHQDIVGFGRVLLTGKEMYPSPKEFGFWVERRGLNTGKLAKHQTERTACMNIAKLVDVGAEIDEDDDNIVPVKLDLTGCKMTTPTDIMKWARKHHRHLFPHLPPRQDKPAIRNAGDVNRELKAELADREETINVLEAKLADLGGGEDQRVDQLKAENAGLKTANTVLRAEHALELAPEGACSICSFCLKVSTEVAALIKAPSSTALICDECVDVCINVLAERAERKSETAAAESGLLSWSGSDDTFWTARGGDGLCYKLLRKSRRSKWNIMIYEPGSDGRQLNLSPIADITEAKALVEADFAEHAAE